MFSAKSKVHYILCITRPRSNVGGLYGNSGHDNLQQGQVVLEHCERRRIQIVPGIRIAKDLLMKKKSPFGNLNPTDEHEKAKANEQASTETVYRRASLRWSCMCSTRMSAVLVLLGMHMQDAWVDRRQSQVLC